MMADKQPKAEKSPAKSPAKTSEKPVKKPQDKRRPGLRAVAGNLSRLTAPALRKRGFVEAAIVHKWASVVGSQLAEYSLPQRLAFPRDSRLGATLHLLVEGSWALEIQHMEPVLIERINTVFGYGAVARLAIRQGRLPRSDEKPPAKPRSLNAGEEGDLDRLVEGVSDESLRNALKKLGRGVMARSEPASD
jgi:hypothetical protein